jgi:hypothetical protein
MFEQSLRIRRTNAGVFLRPIAEEILGCDVALYFASS